MICHIPYSDAQFLYAELHEQLGEPWTLLCRFLVPSQWAPPPQMEVEILPVSPSLSIWPQFAENQIASALNATLGPDSDKLAPLISRAASAIADNVSPPQEKRIGHCQAWQLHAYDSDHNILEIHAAPFPHSWLHDTQNAVFPLQGDLASLFDSCCGAMAEMEWTVQPVVQDAEQWLQLAECRWHFLARVLGKANYWWEHPFSSSGKHWRLNTKDSPSQPSVGTLRWQGGRPDSNHLGILSLTCSQEGCAVGDLWDLQADGCTGSWKIVEAHHSIDLAGSVLGHGDCVPYQVQLSLASTERFVSPQSPLAPIRNPWKAYIATPQGETNLNPLQADGRYPVRFSFEAADSHGWGRIARLQPLAGKDSAMHFPLQAGTEVWLSFLAGEPDVPWICGAAETVANQLSPVTGANSDDFVIQTRNGNILRITDIGTSQGQWEMHTVQGAHLTLDDNAEEVALRSADGFCQLVLNQKQDLVELLCGEKLALQLDRRNDTIELRIHNGPRLQLQGSGQKLNLESPDIGTISLERGKGISLDSQSDLVLRAKRILFQAENNFELACQESRIAVDSAGINLNSEGALQCKSSQDLQLSTQGKMLQKSRQHLCQADAAIELQSVNIKLQADATISQQATLIQLN